MNHAEYEKQMIDGVNRHAEKWDQITFDTDITDTESTDTVKSVPVKNKNVKILGRGFARVVVALFTAATFGLSVLDFIAVASATGYCAVALFIAAIMLLLVAVILLYSQGITNKESKGDGK